MQPPPLPSQRPNRPSQPSNFSDKWDGPPPIRRSDQTNRGLASEQPEQRASKGATRLGIALPLLLLVAICMLLLFRSSTRSDGQLEIGMGQSNSAGGTGSGTGHGSGTVVVGDLDGNGGSEPFSASAPSSISAPNDAPPADDALSDVNEAPDATPHIAGESAEVGREKLPVLLQFDNRQANHLPAKGSAPEWLTPRQSAPESGGRSGGGLGTGTGLNPFIGEDGTEATTAFVIDISGSMESDRRLEKVVKSLERALRHLTPRQRFVILLFNDRAHSSPLGTELSAANVKNIATVMKWLRDVKANGGTNPGQAMELAIGLQPERIVLLSDGEFDPNTAEEIVALNLETESPARIDCVGLAEEVETLKRIAGQSGGIYYQAH